MTSQSETLSGSRGVVSIPSSYPFGETVQRLLAAFAGHGLTVFATIDQAAEAAAVGLTMPPTTLIVFGNPKAGTPLMLAQPLCGINLPLKVLVTESTPGEIRVSFNTATYIIERHSLSSELANNLAPAERLIAGAIVK
jgi:uncharacterized protein (DUF302 family)